MNDFTYGVELEYADVYRFDKLPIGCKWCNKDNTIVNSTGVANDPLAKLWEYGGEINTRPTSSIISQVDLIKKIKSKLTIDPWINYRCNLHIHIGVPDLNKDLKMLKKLMQYIHKNQKEAFKIVEPIPKPVRIDFSPEDSFKGALLRYRRRLVSHQYCVRDELVKRIMKSKTPEEFFNNHANLGKDGRRQWFITPRAGINLRQLFNETDTVEFRHFPGTIDDDEMFCCISWCNDFMEQALGMQKPPSAIYKNKTFWQFPKFRRYDHKIDLIWRITNLKKNKRVEVKANIRKLINEKRLLNIGESRKRSNRIESGYKIEGGISHYFR